MVVSRSSAFSCSSRNCGKRVTAEKVMCSGSTSSARAREYCPHLMDWLCNRQAVPSVIALPCCQHGCSRAAD